MSHRPSRTPARNRLAKPLPEQWRQWLVDQGVPRRKYTAVLRLGLHDGTVIESAVVEEGWIITTDLADLQHDQFERAIDFDVAFIRGVEIVQIV